jgi:hypothetical protein
VTELRSIYLVVLLAAGVAMAACDERAGGGPVPPSGSGGAATDFGPEGTAEGESPQELAERLRAMASEQRKLLTMADQDPAQCEDLCSLSTSICGVKEKLCRIADERVGEESYQQLCREAKQECRDAQQSCIDCVENHVRRESKPAAAPP